MARVSRSRIALLALGILTLLGTSPLPAQENGKLTLTVDGETRSLDIVSCTAQLRGAAGLAGEATDDTDTINFVVSEWSNRARNRAQTVMFTSTSTSMSRIDLYAYVEGKDSVWTFDDGEPAPGPLLRIDGSTVIGSGTLTDQRTHEEHVVEFGVDCAL